MKYQIQQLIDKNLVEFPDMTLTTDNLVTIVQIGVQATPGDIIEINGVGPILVNKTGIFEIGQNLNLKLTSIKVSRGNLYSNNKINEVIAEPSDEIILDVMYYMTPKDNKGGN